MMDNQFKTDEDVLKLTSAMEEALKYVDIVKTSNGLTEALKAYIEGALKQIVECGIFIRQYCELSFGGKFILVVVDVTH